MRIVERLYTQGLLSVIHARKRIYSQRNLTTLVEQHIVN